MGLDMETLASIVGGMRGRGEECGAGELRRLLHQADQRWSILRHTHNLELVSLDPQFRHIGTVGQHGAGPLHTLDGVVCLRLASRPRPDPSAFESRRMAARR